MFFRMLEISGVFVMAWMALSLGVAAGKQANTSAPVALRAGIIGLDTSHAIAFTQLLNSPNPTPELAGVRVVAAYPGGSPDVASSRDRIAGFTREMREKFRVDIADSIEELLSQVDVVLLESVQRPTAPGTGAAGSPGAQAAIHRQAHCRHACRRNCDF